MITEIKINNQLTQNLKKQQTEKYENSLKLLNQYPTPKAEQENRETETKTEWYNKTHYWYSEIGDYEDTLIRVIQKLQDKITYKKHTQKLREIENQLTDLTEDVINEMWFNFDLTPEQEQELTNNYKKQYRFIKKELTKATNQVLKIVEQHEF